MRLAYDEAGAGELVVLLHGFPLSRRMWSEQLRGLSARYRVVAPDLRGHGETPVADGVATMEAMADDVLELVDQLGVRDRFVLGGLSMGGYVALAFARRHPERLRGLILLDTRAAADTPEAAMTRVKTAQVVLAMGVTTVVDSMLPRLFGQPALVHHLDRVQAIKSIMERTRPEGVAAALKGMACRADSRPELARISVPTLVLVGDVDVITPPAESELMARSIPGARLAVIPGAGHMAPVEEPEIVNQVLLDFLGVLSSAPGSAHSSVPVPESAVRS